MPKIEDQTLFRLNTLNMFSFKHLKLDFIMEI